MFLRKIPINIILLVFLFAYYIFFINKGIVIYDEGYYAHVSERVLNGEVPYKDFFLQFPPGYFYLLTLFYKILGTSILTGRILTLAICLGIGWTTLKIVDKFKLELELKIITLAGVASFGFPLINNMALLAWISVLLSLLTVLAFMHKKYIILGIFLSLILLTKQNLGIYFLVFTNIFFLISKAGLKNVIKVNLSLLIPTAIWFLYFFMILSGPDKFSELINFNSRYLSVYPFSYPPLSFITQPTGIFKLLPYYFPFIFSFFVIKEFSNKSKRLDILYFSGISLIGFFGTVYPTSDLLHVYPFFGPVLVSSIIFFKDKIYFSPIKIIILILIGIGFYLTLFREYYRYQASYRYQKFQTEITRTKGIYIDEQLAGELSSLNLFFLINSRKGEHILCYPFCPMVYFILERNNPTRYTNYYPGYLTKSQEQEVIKNLRDKKTRFIVTFLDYKFDTPISKFIQRQKEIFHKGQFRIFEVK